MDLESWLIPVAALMGLFSLWVMVVVLQACFAVMNYIKRKEAESARSTDLP